MSSSPAASASVRDHAVHLRLAQPWHGPMARAESRLVSGDGSWLGLPVASPEQERRRFEADLVLPMREQARHMVLRKAAIVDLGPTHPALDGFTVDVSWRSANLAPLFPVFVGRLEVHPAELVLEGFYAPPGGEVGFILDRALLNIAARGTARWFLTRVADAIQVDGEAA